MVYSIKLPLETNCIMQMRFFRQRSESGHWLKTSTWSSSRRSKTELQSLKFRFSLGTIKIIPSSLTKNNFSRRIRNLFETSQQIDRVGQVLIHLRRPTLTNNIDSRKRWHIRTDDFGKQLLFINCNSSIHIGKINLTKNSFAYI